MSQSRPYTDHAWLDDDKIVIGTANGEIIYVDNFDTKQMIDNAYVIGGTGQGQLGQDGKPLPPMNVSRIKPYS